MDEDIIKEVKSYMQVFKNYKGGPILDLGANIGAFSKLCKDKYPKSTIIAVEPEKENYSLLVENVPNIHHIKAAVGKEKGTTTLYLNSGINKGIHSTRKIRGRTDIQIVRVISFRELLDTYTPEILKIDIEDSEYLIEEELYSLPNYIKGIIIELHLRPQIFRNINAPILLDKLKQQFPIHLRVKSIPKNTWAIIFIGVK